MCSACSHCLLCFLSAMVAVMHAQSFHSLYRPAARTLNVTNTSEPLSSRPGVHLRAYSPQQRSVAPRACWTSHRGHTLLSSPSLPSGLGSPRSGAYWASRSYAPPATAKAPTQSQFGFTRRGSQARLLFKTTDADERRKLTQRPHMIEIDLDEILVLADAPGADISWYELASCWISVHPTSSRLPRNGALPKEVLPTSVPEATEMGSFMVSQPAWLGRGTDDAGRPVLKVKVQERISLLRQHLDTHCILFLWFRRTSVAEASVLLLGWRALPLQDASLYCRLAHWDITHTETCQLVAEARLRCHVSAVPGQIQLPHLEDVSPTTLDFKWSPPMQENGKSIEGYKLMFAQPPSRSWQLLEACVASTTYRLTNLTASTAYLVQISAVNAVGEGEHFKLEMVTAAELQSEDESARDDFVLSEPDEALNHAGLA
eukprot:TRINITY_DN47214_c0_g1_i3.p1 TRINITY_DN47214_c0_g1~~TRINITY_DN47214_c0_g1_i3.p1  ORF type:complete len:430 (-),score=24.27 TRINITY_DN47214_c0_g1_i3:68-1357(-)